MKGAALLLLASGCAFDEGEPFGEIAAATLAGSYQELEDRAVTGDPRWQKLDTSFEIRLTQARLRIERLELVSAAADASLAFNPANPPPGYGLCHNGHCHRDDGALVPYDEIAAGVAGGGDAAPAVALDGGELDLLSDTSLAPACIAGCELSPGRLVLVRAVVGELAIEGRVRDGLNEARLEGEHGFALALPLALEEGGAFTFDTALDLPIDEDEPPRIELALSLAVTAALFDDVDFAAVADAEPLNLGGDEAARAIVREHLAETVLSVSTTRYE